MSSKTVTPKLAFDTINGKSYIYTTNLKNRYQVLADRDFCIECQCGPMRGMDAIMARKILITNLDKCVLEYNPYTDAYIAQLDLKLRSDVRYLFEFKLDRFLLHTDMTGRNTMLAYTFYNGKKYSATLDLVDCERYQTKLAYDRRAFMCIMLTKTLSFDLSLNAEKNAVLARYINEFNNIEFKMYLVDGDQFSDISDSDVSDDDLYILTSRASSPRMESPSPRVKPRAVKPTIKSKVESKVKRVVPARPKKVLPPLDDDSDSDVITPDMLLEMPEKKHGNKHGNRHGKKSTLADESSAFENLQAVESIAIESKATTSHRSSKAFANLLANPQANLLANSQANPQANQSDRLDFIEKMLFSHTSEYTKTMYAKPSDTCHVHYYPKWSSFEEFKALPGYKYFELHQRVLEECDGVKINGVVVPELGINCSIKHTNGYLVTDASLVWRRAGPADKILETLLTTGSFDPKVIDKYFAKSVEMIRLPGTNIMSQWVMEYIKRYVTGWLFENPSVLFKSLMIHYGVMPEDGRLKIVICYDKHLNDYELPRGSITEYLQGVDIQFRRDPVDVLKFDHTFYPIHAYF